MHAALLLIFTLFSLSSFLVILWTSDPYTTTAVVRALFFITLFFSFLGVFVLLNMGVLRLAKRPLPFVAAFRRGFLFATLAFGFVVLEHFTILNIGNAFAIFLLTISLEMFIIHQKHHEGNERN